MAQLRDGSERPGSHSTRGQVTTEMIQVGALSVRFLVEAADSNGA